MEVHMSNLDATITERQLREILEPRLERYGIHAFKVSKPPGLTIAFLTVASQQKGKALIDGSWRFTITTTINSPRSSVIFKRGNKLPDHITVRRLQSLERTHLSSIAQRESGLENDDTLLTERQSGLSLGISTVYCGNWEDGKQDSDNAFRPYYSFSSYGLIYKEGRDIVIMLGATELQIDVSSITSLVYHVRPATNARAGRTKAVLTLAYPPRVIALQQLSRSSLLPDTEAHIAGSCLSYYFEMRQPGDTGEFKTSLHSMFPSAVLVPTSGIEIASHTEGDAIQSFEDDLNNLNGAMNILELQFAARFLVQALWKNALLSPSDVLQLVRTIEFRKYKGRLGEEALTQALQGMIDTLACADFGQGGYKEAETILDNALNSGDTRPVLKNSKGQMLIRKVMITPTGMCLYGPEVTAANRVLRKYKQHADCFLRVTFGDEDGDRLYLDRDVSNDTIYLKRFLSILQNGLDVAGERFMFLGFSHSSLRARSCWFMKPFSHGHRWLDPLCLVDQLGNFDDIKCPAKYAARIGQVFSDTSTVISIDPHIVTTHADVQRNGRVFTDGCGTFSPALWKVLNRDVSIEEAPTAYQIRFQGAKGMISLNTSLAGEQLQLRESMIKFQTSSLADIEVCGTNARPLRCKLNRQVIKILEDLDIESNVFEDLQNQAVKQLKESTMSQASAVEFIISCLGGTATGLDDLLFCLAEINFDVTGDTFLRDILGALLQVELSDLKYRSRIPVPKGITLYGLSDDSEVLEEGQIFVTLGNAGDEQCILTGKVAVTRSPALHPGDIQVATAVEPPADSHLRTLTNCIVFSQKGDRDLPSMLGGGDLDGDLYNILYDERLVPNATYPPAEYPTVQPKIINRAVTLKDVAEFFVDFMQNDQLGRIANLHQVFADLLPEGTKSSKCLQLAHLHSIAVEFSKTGIKVDSSKIPKAPCGRPDFMAPLASINVKIDVSKDLKRLCAPRTGGHKYEYYGSVKVLGKLFKMIPEDSFEEDLKADKQSIFSLEVRDDVLEQLLELAQRYMSHRIWLAWPEFIESAERAQRRYQDKMQGIMSQYAPKAVHMLSEKEVWIGKIVGRADASSKNIREKAMFMKEQFDSMLREIDGWMDDVAERDDDKLICLYVACLHVAVREASETPSGRLDTPLKGFGWFAAAMCLPKLIREHRKESKQEEVDDNMLEKRRLQLADLKFGS